MAGGASPSPLDCLPCCPHTTLSLSSSLSVFMTYLYSHLLLFPSPGSPPGFPGAGPPPLGTARASGPTLA